MPPWSLLFCSWIYNYLYMQSLLITKIVNSIPVNVEVYSIQYCMIKFCSYLRQIGGFLRVLLFPSTNKTTDHYGITEILLNVALSTETTVRGQTCRYTRTHYPDFNPTSLCSCSLTLRAFWKSTNINFIVIGLTKTRFESMINYTRVEYHFTNDAVSTQRSSLFYLLGNVHITIIYD